MFSLAAGRAASPSPGPETVLSYGRNPSTPTSLQLPGKSAVPPLERPGGTGRGGREALTRGDTGRGRGAPGLFFQSHHVDGVLLPRLQSRLVEGGDTAGELGDYPSFVVLRVGEGEAEKARENHWERKAPHCLRTVI